MERTLYVVLKKEAKNGRTSVISPHWNFFEAQHAADIEFNCQCMDDQREYHYLVCRVACRALVWRKGDTARECFDRTQAAPINRFCLYYKVLKTFSL